ncbi:MAG: uridine kinase [Sandaracinaceae bacterium]|nr:MAG: uridine kinase [Sandaracinaceae bacterium]HBQ15272.1 uridine kinase [Myxococcales bacterium]
MAYVVGVAGGTGSGKTTVAETIVASLAPENVAIIQHDHYYRDRPDLSYEDRCELNFDHPESLETDLLVAHLERLKKGETVDTPVYDFKTHRRAEETRRIEPREVIVVEGILVFVERRLRQQLDLKLFVDTPSDIRVFRRIRRDIEKRGRTFESVREQYYATVRPMHLQFVEPSKSYADLIIPEGGRNKVALDLILAKLQAITAA